ncbi:MAG: RNA polymerase sigma factor [Nitrospirae bacterium]|nr:RNA polymerase sigma factor [Nitrospirota bacterium]
MNGPEFEMNEAYKEDYKLVDSYFAGDYAALEELITKYQRNVYAISYRISGDMEEAKDITQKTFMQVVRELKSFRKKSSFKTWLYRVTVNTALNHLRENRGNTVELNEAIADGYIASDKKDSLSLLIEEERGRHFGSLLATLPERQRLSVVLRVYGGLSISETAIAMGCSEGAVKAHYHNGIKKFKEAYMSKEGIL